jgi:sulfate adenylyltransferase
MVSKPHGGKLVNRIASEKRRVRLVKESSEIPKLILDFDNVLDVENLAYGVYSSLEGFMVKEEYRSVIDGMRLPNDVPWTIPITLHASKEELKSFTPGDEIILTDSQGELLALLNIEEIFSYDRSEYASKVYKTLDRKHPGVEKTLNMKEFLVGGKIELIQPSANPYHKYTLYPKETRVLFGEKGWKTIVGFQTRNVPHLGHEYTQKTALSFVDGLFINPVIGRKKPGDFKDELILATYDLLIKNYYLKDTVVLSIYRTEMRYAGPREAIHHAIVRKNFGCTHFIVGRDHAGVGNYYGPYEAQEIFKEFPDLGITPLFFREFFHCKKCGGIVNEKICPHPEAYRLRFSGTAIRNTIMKGEKPPIEMMRSEVSDLILGWKEPFIR